MKRKVKTKIVCTIGPATWNKKILKAMIDEGMTAARVNASFADESEIKRVYKLIRSISDEVALILDTKGHKIRVSDFSEPIHLKSGDTFVLDSMPNKKYIWATYPTLYQEVPVGTKLLLDEGKIELKVTGKDETRLICKVVVGGILTRSKTLTVSGIHLNFPPLTEKDKKDIKTAVACGYDFIAASFIRNVKDIKAIDKLLKGSKTKLISKIENYEGIENLDSIIDKSFGIMVARGDLGVELPLERIGVLQKEIVRRCNEVGKPVIVATQMLESMIENPRPTRAEVSDITNAVFDGADAVMLSAETSVGNYPVECVKIMRKIVEYSEQFVEPSRILVSTPFAKRNTNALAKAVSDICRISDVKAIIVATLSGITARIISRYRPKPPIIAFVRDIYVKRGLEITKGVFPELTNPLSRDKNKFVKQMVKNAYKIGYVSKGDTVVVVAGESLLKKETKLLEVTKVVL